jgi:O-acetyl-ADP-ribose deacetylase (regulator of RNase III)
MQKKIATGLIELRQGDITRIAAHAIVTAANSGLRGGGGVDGAVHRAAGPGLLQACRTIGGCPTGSAVATLAFDLGSNGVRHVIHAVGPVWQGGTAGENDLLESAYQTSLRLAEENGCESIAFPSISTGVYGFPVERASAIAVSACAGFLESGPSHLSRIIFALFDDATYSTFEQALSEL